jgi:NADH-quinone oxidoreductase subunit I
MSCTNKASKTTVRALLADLVSGVRSIIKGHQITLRTLLRPKVTDQYPYRCRPDKEWQPKPGYRGDFALLSDPQRPGGLRCIACMACVNVCPTRCLHIEAEGKGKERHPVEFMVDLGLCMYCWMCIEVCPVGAITMTTDYHNVAYHPDHLIRNLANLKARGEGLTEVQVPVAAAKTVLRSAENKPKPAPAAPPEKAD